MGKHLILMGAPGSGKGTLSQYLKKFGNYYPFSFGDAMRSEIANQTAIGLAYKNDFATGKLAPEQVGRSLFEQHFNGAMERGELFIIDGMIQNQNYVDYFDQFIRSRGLEEKFGYVFLKVSRETASKRLQGRLVCPTCNTVCSNDQSKCNGCNGRGIPAVAGMGIVHN